MEKEKEEEEEEEEGKVDKKRGCSKWMGVGKIIYRARRTACT